MLAKAGPQDDTTQALDSGSSSTGTSSGMSKKASSSKSTSSSGSSGGSGSSNRSSAPEQQLRKLVDPATAWEFACRQQQLLPASVDTLLQLVGTSAKGMLWGAASHAAQGVSASSRDSLPKGIAKSLTAVAEEAADRLQCLVCLYVIAARDDRAQDRMGDLLFESAIRVAVSAGQDPEQQQQQQVSNSTASQPPCPEMLVHYLKPTLLLHCAAVSKAPVADTRIMSHASALGLGNVCLTVIDATTQLQPVGPVSGPSTDSDVQLDAAAAAAVVAVPWEHMLGLPCELQAQAIRDTVSLIARIGRRILRQLAAHSTSLLASPETPASSGSGSGSSSSSSVPSSSSGSSSNFVAGGIGGAGSSGRSSSSSRTTNQPSGKLLSADTVKKLQHHTDTMLTCFIYLDRVWCICADIRPADITSSQRSAAADFVADVLSPHAAVVCDLIQACTRCSAGLLLTNSGNWGRGIAGILSPLCRSATAPLEYAEVVWASAPLLKAALRAAAGLSSSSSSSSSSSNSGCDLKLFSQLISCCKLMRVDPQLRDPEDLCVLMSEAASSFVVQATASPEAPAAVELLPWLVLQGRVFLYLSARLTTALSAVDMQLPAEVTGTAPITKLFGVTLQCGDAAWGCITWVQDFTTSAQLTAEGYDVPQLLQQLQDTQSALEPLRQIHDKHEEASGVPQQSQLKAASSAALGPAVGQLHALGLLLCNLARPHACNNPACSNLAGPSELQLVGGRSAICGGCMKARYCSRVCQRQHWKQHKPVCKKLAAAAAGTAGAARSEAPAPAPVAAAAEASDV